jgi:hypothetical protein
MRDVKAAVITGGTAGAVIATIAYLTDAPTWASIMASVIAGMLAPIKIGKRK